MGPRVGEEISACLDHKATQNSNKNATTLSNKKCKKSMHDPHTNNHRRMHASTTKIRQHNDAQEVKTHKKGMWQREQEAGTHTPH